MHQLRIYCLFVGTLLCVQAFSQSKKEKLDSLFKASSNFEIPLSNKIKIAEEAIELAGNDTALLIGAYANFGSLNLTHSLYKGALLNFSDAISLALKSKNTESLSHNYYLIGNTYMYLDELEKALEYYDKAQELARKTDDFKELGMIHNSKGIVFSKKNELRTSYQAFLKSYSIFEGIDFEFGMSFPLSNIGDYYLKIEQPDTAIAYFERSLKIDKKFGLNKGIAIAYGNIGLGYKLKKEYTKALGYFQKSLEIAEKYQYYKVMYDNYKDISDTYKLKKDFNKSLLYYEKYTQLKDSILNSETGKAIAELQATYDTEKKEKEILISKDKIKELEYNKKIDRYQTYQIISGLALFLLIAAFFLTRLKGKIKRKKQLMEETEELYLVKEKIMKSELDNRKSESIRLESELSNKNKDLTNFALDIARKNEFTQKISTELKHLKSTRNETEKDILLQELIFKTNNHLKINEDFEHFQSNVENVNHQFFEMLSSDYPDLTANEKHLCGLIRLNLTIKDIASIKNISPKSVEMNRYRLRKKLNLSSETDLNQFLIKM